LARVADIVPTIIAANAPMNLVNMGRSSHHVIDNVDTPASRLS
jgi:hypothetical protein